MDRADPIDALYRRIISPGKADGTTLTVDELELIEWVALRHLLNALKVEIIDGGDGTARIVVTARISELICGGYLTDPRLPDADTMERAELEMERKHS